MTGVLDDVSSYGVFLRRLTASGADDVTVTFYPWHTVLGLTFLAE